MTANDPGAQVGGSHYGGGKLQHWDIVAMFHLDYFQGQITKYVMRWKDKNATPAKRREDLQKAKHFLEKYLEEFSSYDEKAHPEDYAGAVSEKDEDLEISQQAVATAPVVVVPDPDKLFEPGETAELLWEQLHPIEAKCWQNEGYYGDGTCLYRCRVCREIFRGQEPPKDHFHAVRDLPPVS